MVELEGDFFVMHAWSCSCLFLTCQQILMLPAQIFKHGHLTFHISIWVWNLSLTVSWLFVSTVLADCDFIYICSVANLVWSAAEISYVYRNSTLQNEGEEFLHKIFVFISVYIYVSPSPIHVVTTCVEYHVEVYWWCETRLATVELDWSVCVFVLLFSD